MGEVGRAALGVLAAGREMIALGARVWGHWGPTLGRAGRQRKLHRGGRPLKPQLARREICAKKKAIYGLVTLEVSLLCLRHRWELLRHINS